MKEVGVCAGETLNIVVRGEAGKRQSRLDAERNSRHGLMSGMLVRCLRFPPTFVLVSVMSHSIPGHRICNQSPLSPPWFQSASQNRGPPKMLRLGCSNLGNFGAPNFGANLRFPLVSLQTHPKKQNRKKHQLEATRFPSQAPNLPPPPPAPGTQFEAVF